MEPVGRRKRIGLVAHDNKKRDLIEWSRYNRILLEGHDLVATGHDRHAARGRDRGRDREAPVGTAGRRPAAGRADLRRRHRPARVLLGPARTPAARSGREGAPADRGRLEHPDRVQPGVGRLHDLVAVDDERLRPDGAGLRDAPQPRARVSLRGKERSGSRRSRSVAVPVNTPAEAGRFCHASRASITSAAPTTLTLPTHDLAAGAAWLT